MGWMWLISVALREAGDGDKGAEVKVVEDFEDDWERDAAKPRSAHWVVGEGRHGGAVEGREGGGRDAWLSGWEEVGRGTRGRRQRRETEGETNTRVPAIASIKQRPSLLH